MNEDEDQLLAAMVASAPAQNYTAQTSTVATSAATSGWTLERLLAANEKLQRLAQAREVSDRWLAAWMRARGFPPELGGVLYLPKTMLAAGVSLAAGNLAMPRYVMFHPGVVEPILTWGGGRPRPRHGS